jgi:hypothetical protein
VDLNIFSQRLTEYYIVLYIYIKKCRISKQNIKCEISNMCRCILKILKRILIQFTKSVCERERERDRELNLSLDGSLFHHETHVWAFFNQTGQLIPGISDGMAYILMPLPDLPSYEIWMVPFIVGSVNCVQN